MRRTVSKFMAAAMALVLLGELTGCGTRKPTFSDGPVKLAYVPLDDRPDNVERAEYLAESLDYDLLMPDMDLYATKLDGQPLNADGTQSGDRAELYEWVLSQEENGCDRYILSLDQLLSGGLVSSRAMTGENSVTLADGTAMTETELLDRLLSLLSKDQNNQVWLLDSVMRLAPTVGYGGFGLNEYNALRDYGMAARPHLEGKALRIESIVVDYRLGAGGKELEVRSAEPLPDGAVENYLAARGRKLRLSAHLLDVLSGKTYANFHVLIGVDDSSAEDSIQKNEIAYLTANLREGDWLLSGVDDLAFKAIAKLYLQDCGWNGAKVSLRYIGGLEAQPACAYDYQPLDTLVDQHLNFFNLHKLSKANGDFQILVLTAPADPERIGDYAWALINALSENRENQLPTVLIDASNDAYGTVIHDALAEQAELGSLLAYSGFLDMAIVTGTAISHGVARYAWLTHTPSPEEDDAANSAFVKALSDSVIKDFAYRNTVRNGLYVYVRDELGGSPDNFYRPEIDRALVLSALETGMEASAAPVLANFSSGKVLVGLSPWTETDCGTLTLSDYRFPWSRVFEIGMEIHRQTAAPEG
jgi:hypothetical protein